MDHINSGRSWSPELRVFLIRCVKTRERLWRKFGSGGQDLDARQTLWQEVQIEISKEYDLYLEIEEIKKTWKNLKDNFLRVKKATNNEGTSKPGGKKWFFFEELKFLDFAELDYRPFHALEPDIETEESTLEPPKKKKRAVRELTMACVSIPIIDSRISTKQNTLKAAIILDLDDDLAEMAKLTAGKWGTTHSKCCPPAQKKISYVDDLPTTAECAAEEKPSLLPRNKRLEGREIAGPDLIDKIVRAINKKRSDYKQGAAAFFARKKMPPNSIKKALHDFDAFVYHNKRRTTQMNKIITSCIKSDEFEQMFKLLENYRDQLPTRTRNRVEVDQESACTESYPSPAELDQDQRKRLREQNILINSRIMEVRREIDRINSELSGQLSVIRRTKLRNALEEAEDTLEKLLPQREENVKIMSDSFHESGVNFDYNELPYTTKVEE